MTIQLYELCGSDENHVFSPHCWKTRMSLAHKGLEFSSVATPFTKIPEIEGGITKTVPLIKDGEKLVQESYEIAKYLDQAYPDRPSLLGGSSGEKLTRFVIAWAQSQLHPLVGALAMKDIHDLLDDVDQTYFRQSRETMIKTTLEALHDGRDVKVSMLVNALMPLKLTLSQQPYIGGETPLFADYVVFGTLQWLRMTCTIPVLPQEGEVAEWFERLLDMYDGLGRAARAAA